jgi:hypothetical protein
MTWLIEFTLSRYVLCFQTSRDLLTCGCDGAHAVMRTTGIIFPEVQGEVTCRPFPVGRRRLITQLASWAASSAPRCESIPPFWSTGARARIFDACLEARGVLVFRRINLSDDQQVRVASSLGTVREEAGFRLKRTPWYGPIAPAASRSCSARTPRMSKGSNLRRAAQLCIARRWSAKRLSLEAALAVGAAYSGQYNGCKRKICAGTRAP